MHRDSKQSQPSLIEGSGLCVIARADLLKPWRPSRPASTHHHKHVRNARRHAPTAVSLGDRDFQLRNYLAGPPAHGHLRKPECQKARRGHLIHFFTQQCFSSIPARRPCPPSSGDEAAMTRQPLPSTAGKRQARESPVPQSASAGFPGALVPGSTPAPGP